MQCWGTSGRGTINVQGGICQSPHLTIWHLADSQWTEDEACDLAFEGTTSFSGCAVTKAKDNTCSGNLDKDKDED